MFSQIKTSKENKEIVNGNDTIKITRTEVVGNEVDIIFSGRVKSSRGGWYETTHYTKTTLTRWLRTHSPFVKLIENRILLIGGNKGIKIKKIEKKPKEVKIWFKIPNKLKKYVVKKGSIALDGISLTVVDVKSDLASVCLIPHTIQITNFKTKNINDNLNIETDVLGKYILK